MGISRPSYPYGVVQDNTALRRGGFPFSVNLLRKMRSTFTFKTRPRVMTLYKSDFLNILSQRGFIHQGSDLEGLDQKLVKGSLSAYCGYDPTGQSLHAGHMVSIMMLHWFQETGHRPVTLMGGGTAMIGDPSFKDKTRPLLGQTEINSNIASIQKSFAAYIRYDDSKNGAIMANNADWLLKLNYMDFLRDYGTYFTINRMLTFDSVKLRLDREQPLTFLEFNYMIMQGYDFVELNRRYDVTLQMGGSDQWGNIVNGIELARRVDGTQVFGLTSPLITTADGGKMGKTAKGAVWLNADALSPYDYWQFWRNTQDADVGRFMRLFTDLPLEEIAELEQLGGAEINHAKKMLADAATAMAHGTDAATAAAETARLTFEEGASDANLPTVSLGTEGLTVVQATTALGFAPSNKEVRRKLAEGAIRVNGQVVTDPAVTVNAGDKLSFGAKKHGMIIA